MLNQKESLFNLTLSFSLLEQQRGQEKGYKMQCDGFVWTGEGRTASVEASMWHDMIYWCFNCVYCGTWQPPWFDQAELEEDGHGWLVIIAYWMVTWSFFLFLSATQCKLCWASLHFVDCGLRISAHVNSMQSINMWKRRHVTFMCSWKIH